MSRADPDQVDTGQSAIETPLRKSMAAVAAEIDRAAACADALQLALSPLLRRGGGEAPQSAQLLDEMTQQLRGVADFVAAIAADCPAQWRLDMAKATARLSLHSQKLRLTFEAAQTGAAEGGELELW